MNVVKLGRITIVLPRAVKDWNGYPEENAYLLLPPEILVS